MKEIVTHVDIQAPLKTIWAQLTKFEYYPEWNPFIEKIEGVAEEGATLTIHVILKDQKKAKFKAKVTKVVWHKELRWEVSKFMFKTEHIIAMKQLPTGGTRFVQKEEYSGALVAPNWKKLDKVVRRGLSEMNIALKAVSEASV